jgi:signal transduction histidine kinase
MLVPGGHPVYETVATEGQGVFEAFREVFRMLLQSLVRRHGLEVEADDGDGLPEQLLPQLARAARNGSLTRRNPDCNVERIVVPQQAARGASRAIAAMLAMASAHASQASQLRQVDGRNAELMAVNRVARSILSAMEIDNLLVVLLDATIGRLDVSHAGVVMFDPVQEGALKTHVTGFGRDPALGLAPSSARRFFDLMRDSDGPIPADSTRDPELLEALRQVDGRVQSAIFQPLKLNSNSPSGWIGIYLVDDEPRLNASALLFLSSISRLAALGLEKIGKFDALQRAHKASDAELQEVNANLEMAQARVRALNRGLESRVCERTQMLDDSMKRLQRQSAESANTARLRGVSDLADSFVGEVHGPVDGLATRLDKMRTLLDELRAAAAQGTEEERLAAAERFNDLITACLGDVKHLDGFVGSLRRLGGGTDGDPVFPLNSAVADAVTLLEQRIEDCATLDLRLGKIPEIPGDPAALSQLVVALVTNAMEAVERKGERGTITVTTYASGDTASLRIKDDGAGIAADLLPRVCEPFVTSKHGRGGAGLGLYAAREAIEAQGGELRIQSEPGEGASITVDFALAPAPVEDRLAQNPVV